MMAENDKVSSENQKKSSEKREPEPIITVKTIVFALIGVAVFKLIEMVTGYNPLDVLTR